MPEIIFVDSDGRWRSVEVPRGESLMRGALDNMIEGMVGECGGGLACATCHCYVDEEWIDRVGTVSTVESEMLEITASERRRGSRLSCQILAADELEGLIVHLPQTQY